jgi:hypothetical protein
MIPSSTIASDLALDDRNVLDWRRNGVLVFYKPAEPAYYGP